MHPGSTATFYRWRRVLLIGACVAPVLVLGGVWLAINAFLLTPRVPNDRTPGDKVVEFIVSPRGLPGLAEAKRDAILETQIRRIMTDAAFREQFLSAYRTSTTDEQAAFRANLFDVFKPRVMVDVQRFRGLVPAERPAFLDGRIIEYNRLAALWGNVRISKDSLGPGASDPRELIQLLLSKTTEEEREQGAAYFSAYAQRVGEILADPELKRSFEERIKAAP